MVETGQKRKFRAATSGTRMVVVMRRYLIFSILITVNWPLMRSGINLIRSPALTAQHCGIASVEHHSHAVVHFEFLQGTVLERCRFV